MPKRRPSRTREYQRSARLNELLREVIAEELERIDDDRLGWVSIVSVEVDNELTKARVYLSALEAGDENLIRAITEYKGRFKKAVASSARLRRVPDLVFMMDPSIEEGSRIEEILSNLDLTEIDGE